MVPYINQGSMYRSIADAHPTLKKGLVWCHSCGTVAKVHSAECLRSGWPKCCGYTMSLDEPKSS